MVEAFPTELLVRILQASPDQLGAIDRMLGGTSATCLSPPPTPAPGEAKRVFLLMQRLECGPRQRKAALATVFRLTVLEGLSQRLAAARCGCAESLVCARVAKIEQALGMRIERLRNLASELLSLETAAKGEPIGKKNPQYSTSPERPTEIDEEEEPADEDQEGT